MALSFTPPHESQDLTTTPFTIHVVWPFSFTFSCVMSLSHVVAEA